MHQPPAWSVVVFSTLKETAMKNFLNGIHKFFVGFFLPQTQITDQLHQAVDLVEIEKMQERMVQSPTENQNFKS